MVKYLDYAGLAYFWTQLKSYFVAQETGKGLSSNDFTDTYKSTLDNLSTTLAGYKTVQDAVADPTASGTAISFIDTISQDTNGEISVTKKTVQSATPSVSGEGGQAGLMSAADKEKLDGVDYSSKADKVASATNGNFAGLDSNGNLTDSGSKASDFVAASTVGAANGVAPLNANQKVDAQYLPSYVDDVIEAYPVTGKTELASDWLALDAAGTQPITPEAGKIYILMADSTSYGTNSQFRWASTTYVKMNDGGVSSITTAEIDTIIAS